MAGLAALPSASVLLVVARSAEHGFRAGCVTALGIVAGDLVFVGAALLGVTSLSATLGASFAILRSLGALYLVWLGGRLLWSLRSSGEREEEISGRKGSGMGFFAGLFLTLGDVKAIVFYASLFPQLVEVKSLGMIEIGILLGVTTIAVGGVKCAYALGASRLRLRSLGARPTPWMRGTVGSVLLTLGAYLFAKS